MKENILSIEEEKTLEYAVEAVRAGELDRMKALVKPITDRLAREKKPVPEVIEALAVAAGMVKLAQRDLGTASMKAERSMKFMKLAHETTSIPKISSIMNKSVRTETHGAKHQGEAWCLTCKMCEQGQNG